MFCKNVFIILLLCFNLSAYESPLILLLGAPGSGKGTIGAKLNEKVHLPHISTGNLFRENLKNEGRLGEIARSCYHYMEQGLLIPDPLILEMLQERVAQSDCQNGYILEGYPRTSEQAHTFIEQLTPGRKVHIVELDVPDALLQERLSGRLICSDCQQTYHRSFAPPITENVCDKCGGHLFQRPDDQKEAVANRLARYYQQHQPVFDILRKHFTISSIACDNNTEQNVQQVFNAINYYPRDYLKTELSAFPFKGVEKFYDVVGIYKNPSLMRYIVDTYAAEAIAKHADFIAAPEARSLPLLGAVSFKTDKPALFIRKAGKTPGPVFSVTYTTGYSTETLEFSHDESLKGKKVLIIDDGIANGETMLATISLLKQAGMEVVGCCIVIEHHYSHRHDDYAPWEPLTLTLFDL